MHGLPLLVSLLFLTAQALHFYQPFSALHQLYFLNTQAVNYHRLRLHLKSEEEVS